jgi:hypothetical protein
VATILEVTHADDCLTAVLSHHALNTDHLPTRASLTVDGLQHLHHRPRKVGPISPEPE